MKNLHNKVQDQTPTIVPKDIFHDLHNSNSIPSTANLSTQPRRQLSTNTLFTENSLLKSQSPTTFNDPSGFQNNPSQNVFARRGYDNALKRSISSNSFNYVKLKIIFLTDENFCV